MSRMERNEVQRNYANEEHSVCYLSGRWSVETSMRVVSGSGTKYGWNER